MYELLLNAAKILVSKDARDASKNLIHVLQDSPDWKKDICTLELRLDSSSREQATLIRDITTDKLSTLQYPDAVLESFRRIYIEMILNAFDYGLIDRWWRRGKVEVVVEITQSYVALLVRNSKGIRLDLERAIDEQYRRISSNPDARRGRGLLLMQHLADELFSLENGRAIKAVLYIVRVIIDYFCVENLAVFSIISGIYNPSLPARLEQHVLHHPGLDVILDFSAFFDQRSTNTMGAIVSLREKLGHKNQRVVVIANSSNVTAGVDNFHAANWAEALEMLGRSHLLDKVTQRKEKIRLDETVNKFV